MQAQNCFQTGPRQGLLTRACRVSLPLPLWPKPYLWVSLRVLFLTEHTGCPPVPQSHGVTALLLGLKPGSHSDLPAPTPERAPLLLLFSQQVVSDSLQPHDLQCAKLPCPSLPPGVSWVCFLDAAKYLSQNSVSSVAQLCLTLCNPKNCSTSGLPAHHQLLEFAQTHVNRVSDAIQPSHSLSSSSPPAPNPSQH